MNSLRTWKDLLESLHKKSGFYWPTTNLPFTHLCAFLVGYQCGYHLGKHGSNILPEQLVPDDFHRFVVGHFGNTYPSSKGWQGHIRDHTASEQEAFDLFFKLRDEYERQLTNVG